MPAVTMAAPVLVGRTPNVTFSAGHLAIEYPVVNTGDASATRLTLTSVVLSIAPRLDPTLPWVLGDLFPNTSTLVNSIYSAPNATPGTTATLTVGGTYLAGSTLTNFTLTTQITVPQSTPEPEALLLAKVQATVTPSTRTWAYAVLSLEPSGSQRYVNAFSIDMVGPFSVVNTPNGWNVLTDNATYVGWYAKSASNYVAPGLSKDGFRIQAQSSTTSEGRALC